MYRRRFFLEKEEVLWRCEEAFSKSMTGQSIRSKTECRGAWRIVLKMPQPSKKIELRYFKALGADRILIVFFRISGVLAEG
jgi:hypothetical protein